MEGPMSDSEVQVLERHLLRRSLSLRLWAFSFSLEKVGDYVPIEIEHDSASRTKTLDFVLANHVIQLGLFDSDQRPYLLRAQQSLHLSPT